MKRARGLSRVCPRLSARTSTRLLLDQAALLQQLLLEGGDRVQGLLGVLLAGDGLVELLLLLDQQLEERRHVPHVLLPVEAGTEGTVPGTEGQIFGRAVDALQPALAAG